MGRLYSVPYSGTLTAAGGNTDLLSVAPADDKPVRLRGFILSQTSEVKDSEEEGLRITVRRMTATWTVGSGGAAITAAAPIGDSAEPVWGFTARCNDTTISTTTGTNQILYDLGWNVRNTPFEFYFPEEKFCPKARQTEAIVVTLETTPADDIAGACLTFLVEEE